MSGSYQPGDYSGDRDLDRYGYRRAPGLPAPTAGGGSAAAAGQTSQDAAVAAALARSRSDEYGHLAGPSSYHYAAAAAAAAARLPPMPYGNPYAALQGPHSAYPAASPLGDYVSHKQAAVQHAAAVAEYAATYPYGLPGAGAAGANAASSVAYHPEHLYGASGPASSSQAHHAHDIAVMQEAFRSERAASLKRGGYQAHFGPPLATARGPMPASLYSAHQPAAAHPSLGPPSAVKSMKPSGKVLASSRTLTPRSSGESPGDGSESDDNSEEFYDDDAEDVDGDDVASGGEDDGGRYDDDDSEMARFARGGGPRRKESAVMSEDGDGKPVVIDRGHTWYIGSVPLGVDDDKYWLSELQVYLRANFAEAFAATEEDIAAPMHGRNKPIALGQVGIRCMHCKLDTAAERGQQATSYPSLISGIYNSVQQMLRLHLDCCLSMPSDIRKKIEQLKLSCSSRGGRKQYWVDSAKRLGLVDTPHGIHFIRDPSGPLPPLTGPSVNSNLHRKKKVAKEKKKTTPMAPPKAVDPPPEADLPPPPPIDARPLVFPEDKSLISDYLYLTLEQMAVTTLMEADRVGCYKTRRVGFPGLACRHCVGQAGCGRYFPASEASLSQTTTSQTIMNHVRNCRRCPVEIRENLEIMKRNRMGPEGKRSDKPKHGGRKVFFHRLWSRIQGLPIDDDAFELDDQQRKKRKKARRKRDDDHESGADDDESDSEGGLDSDGEGSGAYARNRPKTSPLKRGVIPWFDGCVTLTKTDDPHWLSEMECFARSELVEAFCLTNRDDVLGSITKKEPVIGQVGIRCVFCKNLDPSERQAGCIIFPESLSTIHTKVGDMIRFHFSNCSSMTEEARQTFKSLKGFDAKTAGDDSSQYWVDSARDIGLANMPPETRDGSGWGVTFRRDPLQPSPADDLDLENTGDQVPSYAKNSIVRPEDRGECTDQIMLLLQQVRQVVFKNSDRRAGPGSRGRDRAMGFPGLSCKHCSNKSSSGRYFPVSTKNLTESTINSLQGHVASCPYCPEHIKASLAYLGHRSILQKAELSGSWKKTYFQKIWSRLHVERDWKSAADDADDSGGNDYYSFRTSPNEDKSRGGDRGSDEEEDLGDHMNVLVKAAAIWLTEQDGTSEPKGASSRTNKAAPSSASKRSVSSRSASADSTAGATPAATSSKRRRVHF